MIPSRSAISNISLMHAMCRLRECGPKIMGNPKVDARRLNFCDLGKSAGGPVFFYPANDESFSLDGFRLLMLHRCRVAIAKLAERELSLRGIDLLSLLF